MSVEIIGKELSYKIVEAAIEVHRQLGPGYVENLYEEALKIELRQRGYRVDQHRLLEVQKSSAGFSNKLRSRARAIPSGS